MVDDEVDAVVVGLGVGGEEVAGRLAGAGLSVVGVEHRLVGGECPYWGCVPSKMMIRAGDLLAEARRVPGMAGRPEGPADRAPGAPRGPAEGTPKRGGTGAARPVPRPGGKPGGGGVGGHP